MAKIKGKERILKATSCIQGNSHDYQLTFQHKLSRPEGRDTIFKVMKGVNLQQRISFRFDGEIRSFTDKQAKSSAPSNQLYKKCSKELL